MKECNPSISGPVPGYQYKSKRKDSPCERTLRTPPLVDQSRTIHQNVAPVGDHFSSLLDFHLVLALLFIPSGRDNLMIQLDVFPQIVLFRKSHKILLYFRRILIGFEFSHWERVPAFLNLQHNKKTSWDLVRRCRCICEQDWSRQPTFPLFRYSLTHTSQAQPG